MLEDLVRQHQQDLLAGARTLNIALGLDSPAAHVERAEREVLDRMLSQLGELVGPAARLIDCGPFTGLRTAQVLAALERPKAIVLMNRDIDPRIFDTLNAKDSTAEISVAPATASPSSWDLPAIGSGTSLAVIAGGGLGFLNETERSELFQGAAQTLKSGDFLLLTLEHTQNAAVVEAAYQEFGQHLVRSCLTRLGKSHGLEPRIFHHAASQQVQFGALAQKDATIQWQDVGCGFKPGDWLAMGAAQQFTTETLTPALTDFDLEQTWRSGDQWVELVLLKKK
ncbi:MAG: L-histidine N(alpha)-methyltransferase [Hyphomonadaceae bacterium]|jgi:uncharacterized SAM-dependent methyltransferase|uniref:L-histidine N(alpha)-methyltransferase n=1 Tax=Aquidulcibacter sp. TaxID=2052990 RepID=UPI0022C39D9E|nr:L-histidine N(alpha)-methyltransferase [Aquidulcibacter sp.]MCZ8206908.1 L-histidine N(alpha)-methyltransferase [Aquidulcibacter sp.]